MQTLSGKQLHPEGLLGVLLLNLGVCARQGQDCMLSAVCVRSVGLAVCQGQAPFAHRTTGRLYMCPDQYDSIGSFAASIRRSRPVEVLAHPCVALLSGVSVLDYIQALPPPLFLLPAGSSCWPASAQTRQSLPLSCIRS